MNSHTIAEQEQLLGERLKALRLDQNLTQKTLAQRAGIGLGTLKNLEGGSGSTIATLIAVLRVLGREDWLASIAPIATINPLLLSRDAQPRQRASSKTKPQKAL